jgi:ankyrin repeat protein
MRVDGGGYTTALHAAVWRQNAPLVRLLLDQKGISLNDIDVDGYSALAIAHEKGNPEIIDMLLKAGADPSLVRRCRACRVAAVVSRSGTP